MIEVHLQGIKLPKLDHENVIQALQIILDKEKFCGNILLSYELGQLKYVKATQTFTPDALVDYLSR